ncbi:inositol monophosphatase family protein [Cellulosimicrobium marinum]|uniref:inositol monophosphatase family protein n=1 Tax=Cellulosimicrobium marinum TaxID=1638992 RepID=UPI001E5E881A|nr:inositol monophosphatase family protein [Cellulosimicrobium marinum]MCB7136198.1 inositol monophosphatase family protein [Cellulosimicrobium marinum]
MSSETELAAESAVDLALSILHAGAKGDRVYKTDRDFATATDFAIEDAVRAHLARETPGLGFLGEERGHTGNRDRYWCLDPIDGTTNFARGLPNYGVSLALVVDGVPTFGTIALPAYAERYVTRDGVAWVNGERTTVSTTSGLPEAVVSVGDFATGSDSAEKNQRRLGMVERLAQAVGRVRMLGSAATDLAWLAGGRLDAVVIDANRTWDVAAGVAVASAAGAVVTHLDGTRYSLAGRDVLAATPLIHAELVSSLGYGRSLAE